MKSKPLEIYMMGMCGVGMGNLAGLLHAQGHHVSGSDVAFYPPMSTALKEWGLKTYTGYDASHLSKHPDLVIVGNVIRENNPEAVYARQAGLKMMSMPEALAEFAIQSKHSIVITGTHGKTTTTALASHLLTQARLEPSFLFGGRLANEGPSFSAGQGNYFVVEGDEYDTAYFDKRSKFVHYRAQTTIISSLEFDHADIFSSIEAIENSFSLLLDGMKEGGTVGVWEGATRARKLLEAKKRPLTQLVYSTRPNEETDVWLKSYHVGPAGLTLEPVWRGQSMGVMSVPLWGVFNAQNVLGALVAISSADLSAEQIKEGLACFPGVQKRMEIVGEKAGITVVEDFAHHPTAVKVTLEAARTRWPNARIWAVFEPRSATSRRNIFEAEYVDAFSLADCVVIAHHSRLVEVPENQRFQPEKLAQKLQNEKGINAFALEGTKAIVDHLERKTLSGDVVLLLSNGDFEGLSRAFLGRHHIRHK